MQKNEDLSTKLQELLHFKKSKKFYAERLNISEEEVGELLKELKKEPAQDYCKECFPGEETKKVNVEKGTIESTVEITYEPQSIEQLAKLHKIDLSKYKISNYWSKLRPNGKFTSSVLASLKKPQDYTVEDFTKFLSKWQISAELPEVAIDFIYPGKEKVDIELNLSDFHLAKKTVQGDTVRK